MKFFKIIRVRSCNNRDLLKENNKYIAIKVIKLIKAIKENKAFKVNKAIKAIKVNKAILANKVSIHKNHRNHK
jgi:hypothetical protein